MMPWKTTTWAQEHCQEEGEVDMGSYMNDSNSLLSSPVSYDWKGRYMLTASLRHEGSSKFGENHKWATSPPSP
jgi:alcohol dehydrogenase YqhD (iron-dependent ADH family)